MAERRGNLPVHRGLTLVELLMVISIMTIMMAVAIPLVRPAFENRLLREASRQANAFFAGAKARAAETGRPVGVWMDAVMDPVTGGKYAVRMHLAEVAPGYNGSKLGVRCSVEPINATEGRLHFWDWDARTPPALPYDEATYLAQLVSVGERFYMRFDHKGPYHPCTHVGSGEFQISIPLGVPPGTEHVVPTGVRPVGQTFEILRGPSKSLVSPLTLPGDTVIDLSVSGVGVGDDAIVFAGALPDTPIIVLFGPSGIPEVVYVNYVSYPPTAAIHLLIGQRAKVLDPTLLPDALDPERSNLADPANLWLTINHRAGAVTTEVNSATSGLSSLPDRVRAAREFARASKQKGGQ